MSKQNQDWINVPTGSTLEISTTGTASYNAAARIKQIVPGHLVPAYSLDKKDLDPGPAKLTVPDTGTVSATIFIDFLSHTQTTVTVNALVRPSQGAPLKPIYVGTVTGQAGDAEMVFIVTATGINA